MYYQYRASDIAAIDTKFRVFSYDAVCSEHQTHPLLDAERMRYMLCHERVLDFNINMFKKDCLFNSKDFL